MPNTTALWTNVKDELRERRERRAAYRTLRADLAHYRTPAEIEDLLVAVDTQDAQGGGIAEATVIRAILQENLHEYYATQAPVRRVAGL